MSKSTERASTQLPKRGVPLTTEHFQFYDDQHQKERVARAFSAVADASLKEMVNAAEQDACEEDAIAASAAIVDLFVLAVEEAAAKIAGYDSWHALETARAKGAIW
jgi:hypothetical protein